VEVEVVEPRAHCRRASKWRVATNPEMATIMPPRIALLARRGAATERGHHYCGRPATTCHGLLASTSGPSRLQVGGPGRLWLALPPPSHLGAGAPLTSRLPSESGRTNENKQRLHIAQAEAQSPSRSTDGSLQNTVASAELSS